MSYSEVQRLLAASPLLHAASVVVIEYPKEEATSMYQTLGSLALVADRRFGRTHVAVYGPQEFALTPLEQTA